MSYFKQVLLLLVTILLVPIVYASCNKFRVFQDVKVVEPGNMFDGCIGYITDGWDRKDGPMYRITLTSCPNRKHISHVVTSGEEYLKELK